MSVMDLAPQWFRREMDEHRVEILHDDGLYRHVRMQRPDTILYYYDLVTWPGHLVVGGDIEHYHFSRLSDMFEFFAGERQAPGINPDYWAEKLQGPDRSGQAMRYSEDALRRRLHYWAEDEAEWNGEMEMYPSLLIGAIDRLLDGNDPDFGPFWELWHEPGARELLEEMRAVGILHETWEWELREHDRHFLRACWAIVWGIEQYREAKAAVPA